MNLRWLWFVSIAALLGCTPEQDWITLFDGQTLDGWMASENKDAFRIEEGAIVCDGDRSHLFYEGPDGNAVFKNFEFSADVKTTPGANSGIYFHTTYQEQGWPEAGYEAQVFNSHQPTDGNGYIERKMTGSLYAIRNTYKSPASDNTWFNYRILVQGKTIRIYIDDHLISDYTEPENPWRRDNMIGRILSEGTFALQCHDPKSTVYYKNIRVRPLPDDMATPGLPLQDRELDRRLTELAGKNFPLIDLHVHLKGGLEKYQALAQARKFGYTYGFAINCGLKFPINSDKALNEYLTEYEKPPHTYLAMQAEGREWRDLFSQTAIEKFDYVFTDAMTWTNKNGKRMRLWIPEETEIGDKQDFMEQLVSQIETIFSTEPVDIYVNPTYLPGEIAGEYDELWTPERMDRVIATLVENNVALEINALRNIPSPAFLKRAKKGGVKFTFGTNNRSDKELGHMQYCLDMIEELDLKASDMWIP